MKAKYPNLAKRFRERINKLLVAADKKAKESPENCVSDVLVERAQVLIKQVRDIEYWIGIK